MVAVFRQRRAQPGHIQRRGLGPGMGVPARQHNRRIAAQGLLQPLAAYVAFGKSDENQRDAPPLPLDQCIGGQRCGQGHHRDGRTRHTGVPQHRIHRIADAHRQVALGGQRLGGRDDARVILDQHRIGIGSARIDTQQNRHELSVFRCYLEQAEAVVRR